MKAHVIIPNYRNDDTLPRTLASIRAAAAEWRDGEVETVVVEDREGRGLSWARNEGLRRAFERPADGEEFVFFCDADDTVRPGFFAHPVARLVETAADICVWNCSSHGMKRSYDLDGAETVREVFARAFLGIGWSDVFAAFGSGRRQVSPKFWERVVANRERAGVWRFAFRRELLERNRIRFNERLRIYEDAPFLVECALHACRVRMLDEVLYDYEPGENGIIRKVSGTKAHWDYKREIIRERRRLDALAGGTLRRFFGASQLLGRFEMLRHWRR